MKLMRVGTHRGTLRRTLLAAGAITAAIALAACTGGGSAPATGATDQPASGQLDIYFLAGATSDPFMSTIKRGAEDAAKALNTNLHWSPLQNYSNIGPDLVQLLRSASSSKPAAIIAPNWVPDAENPTFKEITAAGTPLILFNDSGNDSTAAVGALYYIGSDNGAAGQAAGEYMVQHDVKHVLCVNTNPGTAIQQERCGGLEAGIQTGGGSMTELPLSPSDFGNQTAIAQAIKAALLKDPSIDGLITLTLQDADIAASALSQADLTDKVKFGTFDANSSQLDRIQAGTQMLAIDQNGYMQGYLSVSLAYQYAKWGMKLPDTALLTGPSLITEANVKDALAGAQEGVR